VKKTVLAAPFPVRGHVLPWKTDVLPPRNDVRYAAKAARAVEGSVHEASTEAAAPVADPPSRSLVDVMADALGVSKGKTRKAIQSGKAWVRGAEGERQVFDPDYRLGTGETARLDS